MKFESVEFEKKSDKKKYENFLRGKELTITWWAYDES